MGVPTHLTEILAHRNAVETTAPPAIDETYMRRAATLAWQAAGRTRPNPMVGAVVVAGDEIVGEGYHARCGDAHGEIVALDAAGVRARGATMYVTLEPCAHHGRTPPCVDRIIESGLSRVVVTTLDPDHHVDGRGIDTLRRAGVRVDVGCLAPASVVQNLGYYKNRLAIEPTVTLKMAATMDGKISSAPGRRDDITGSAARRYVHRMRATHDCVVVGVNTVLVDSPALDCRYIDTDPEYPLALPVPVVLDSRLRLPAQNRWSVEERPYIVLAGRDAPRDLVRAIEAGSGRVVLCDSDAAGVTIPSVLNALAELDLSRVLVEGGAGVFTSFVRSGCWDALFLFQSSKLFGPSGVPLFRGEHGDTIDGHLVDSIHIEGDVLHRFLSARAQDSVLRRVTGLPGRGHDVHRDY